MLRFPLRDLRCVTKSFDISQVLVRREAIILNLKYVRAILMQDKVMLLDELHVSDELVSEVRHRIKSPFPARNEPFEGDPLALRASSLTCCQCWCWRASSTICTISCRRI
jgi:hypothetical protein